MTEAIIEQSNIMQTIPEGQERENGAEELFKEIMAKIL